MKIIGLIGGMSWESSLVYYRILNETVKDRLGGLHSAECVMVSVEFADFDILMRQRNWSEIARLLVEAAKKLEKAGAEFVVLCTNTMHIQADEIQANIKIPFLHIADATAEAIKAAGIKRIGLLGTRFTMEEDFYKGRLAVRHNLQVIIPEVEEREGIHRVIFDELVVGKIRPESREQFQKVMQRLVLAGAEGIILGCTEIGLLVQQEDCSVPLFDTTRIHAQAAVDYALG